MMKRTQPIFRHVSQRAARLARQMKAALILMLLVAVPCVAQAIPAATASPISPPPAKSVRLCSLTSDITAG